MDITLPKRIDVSQTPLKFANARIITVIGANGAGKTRFCRKIMEDVGDHAFRISALEALFPKKEVNTMSGSIDMLYSSIEARTQIVKGDVDTEIEKLAFLLFHDEFLSLLKYKMLTLEHQSAPMDETNFDRLTKAWDRVFPNNKILRESGKLLFQNDKGPDKVGAMSLSDGERAVFYYLGAAIYAMPGAVIFVDNPALFLHNTIMQQVWNIVEEMRPDCTFIYNTHDIDFATSRVDNKIVWVKNFDVEKRAWDYEIVAGNDSISEELYIDLLGSRKPVLFVEGDAIHSIDSKLYPLIFPEYSVRPLGSCNKVIEATRSFNDLQSFHHLDSHGLVDRDRRTEKEVQYLRDKKIFVPDVAEIENILMLPGVIEAVARRNRKNPQYVIAKVSRAVINLFKADMRNQALMHVRHMVKRNVEYRIDRKFANIGELENHMRGLVEEIDPRGMYRELCDKFSEYIAKADYVSVLRVFNYKQMLSDSNVAQLCGLNNKEAYIKNILFILKENNSEADAIRLAVKQCFRINETK